MAAPTVGDQGVFGLTVCLPRVGFWHADAIVDVATQLSGRVTVDLGQLQLEGTVLTGAPYTDTGYYRIVGGAGGLAGSKLCKPRAFSRCTLQQPLVALLDDMGEQLDDVNSDPAVLGQQLGAWFKLGVAGGRQLRALLESAPAGTAYRFSDNGKLWVGKETWPDSGLDFEEIGQLPHEGRVEITTEDATLKPGVLLDGKKVSYVEHRLDSGRLRTLVLLEADA